MLPPPPPNPIILPIIARFERSRRVFSFPDVPSSRPEPPDRDPDRFRRNPAARIRSGVQPSGFRRRGPSSRFLSLGSVGAEACSLGRQPQEGERQNKSRCPVGATGRRQIIAPRGTAVAPLGLWVCGGRLPGAHAPGYMPLPLTGQDSLVVATLTVRHEQE
jgi:hypothetical protein